MKHKKHSRIRFIIIFMATYSILYVIFLLVLFSSYFSLPSGYLNTKKYLLSNSKVNTSKSKIAAGFQFGDWFKKIMSFSNPFEASNADGTVAVLGASGRTGREIVKQCLDSGRRVIAISKSPSKSEQIFSAELSNRNLVIRSNIDLSNTSTIDPKIFDDVTQVVTAYGPGFDNPSVTSEMIDYQGTLNVISALLKSKFAENKNIEKTKRIADLSLPNAAKQWSRLDDNIMGGRSSSQWEDKLFQDEHQLVNYSRWSGTLVTSGGGFCGTVLPVSDPVVDISSYDGISLRVRGDGYRYKFRVKAATTAAASSTRPPQLLDENQIYQASFDTTGNQWTDILIPFSDFFAVKRSSVLYSAPPLSSPAASALTSIGFILSKFQFNEELNPTTPAGQYRLDVAHIGVYRAARPDVVMISSAGAERINRLDSEEERGRDIPIVQLNPQGILNWKYKAEQAIRCSPFGYTILRPTGLAADSSVNDTRRVLCHQGDAISGRITRQELARVVVGVLNSGNVIGKTIELKRDESDNGLMVKGDTRDSFKSRPEVLDSQFRYLCKDADRVVRGLPPLPYARDPAPPVSQEVRERILNDPRVQAQARMDKAAA